MNIDVAKAIKELLFDRESIILPGLGAFIGKPAASEVDYVQGAVQPPTKNLEFNTNIVINDGVLVNYIQKDSLVTGQEAKMAIENYVSSIKNALEQKEIVDIPDIGRLYRDYEQKIRFMPEGTNFETDSFGLPNVKFHPVLRKKTNPQAAATSTSGKQPTQSKAAPATKNVPPSPSVTAATKVVQKSWAEEWMPWLIVAAAVLLAILLFFGLRGCGGDNNQQAVVPPERINVKPTEDAAPDEAAQDGIADLSNGAGDADNTAQPADEEEAATPPTYDLNDKTTSNSYNRDTNSGKKAKQIFVVVHSFSSRANAMKFSRDLEKAGYIPTIKKYNGLRRVGVEVPASRSNEVDSLIKELGRKFKAKPVIADF